jgi:cytochrome P450
MSYSWDGLLKVAASIGCAVGVSMVWYHAHLSYARKGEAPIKWSWVPVLGDAIYMGIQPMKLMRSSMKKFGEIFGLVVAGKRMFIVTDPHSVDKVLAPNSELGVDEFHNDVLKNFFGVSVGGLLSAPETKVMAKVYHEHLTGVSGIAKLIARMQVQTQRINCSSHAQSSTLFDYVGRVMFEITAVAMFNEGVAECPMLYDEFNEFDKALPLAIAGIDVFSFNNKLSAVRDNLNKVARYCTSNTSGLIKRRNEIFMKLVEDENTPFSAGDMEAYQNAMLWASVGNSIPSLFWTLYFIMANPDVREKVMEEQSRCIAEAESDIFSVEDFEKMVYLNACITEALRLCSGSLIMRYVRKPLDLKLASGKVYRFRKGDMVGVCPALVHFDPEVYHEPYLFNPDRWLIGETPELRRLGSLGKVAGFFKGGKEINASFSFMPFGRHPICPGRKLVFFQIKMLIGFLLPTMELLTTLDGEKFDDCMPHRYYDDSLVDAARAGIGIFGPKSDAKIKITLTKPQDKSNGDNRQISELANDMLR